MVILTLVFLFLAQVVTLAVLVWVLREFSKERKEWKEALFRSLDNKPVFQPQVPPMMVTGAETGEKPLEKQELVEESQLPEEEFIKKVVKGE